MTAPPQEPMDPLEMALNCVRDVERLAKADMDETQAHALGLGNRQHAAAEMAAYLALVSIAADLRRLAGREN